MKQKSSVPFGFSFPSSMTYDEYVEEGKRIKLIYAAAPWMVADWLNFGEAKYGEMYTQAEEIFNLSYSRLTKLKQVGHIFIASRRRPALYAEHHIAVMGIKSIEVQEKILDKAEKRRWNTRQIREFASRIKKLSKITGEEDAFSSLENSYKRRFNISGKKEKIREQIYQKIDRLIDNAPDDVFLFFDAVLERIEYQSV
jgi:hypothetical protein